jgi:outer membrane protein W
MVLLSFRPALANGIRIGLSASYFAPGEELFKTIYGSGGAMPAVSLAYGFRRFEVRAEAGYFAATGAMTESGEELSFRMVPLFIGARYEILKGSLRPYLGAGLGSAKYNEDYPERFEDVSGSSTLTYAEAGLYYSFLKGLHLDVNARWIGAKAKTFDRETIDLGGMKYGIGVGYAF